MRRRILVAICIAGVAATVAVGLAETGGPTKAPRSVSMQDARGRLAGAPAPLAALHRQSNRLLGGGPAAYRSRLAALRGHPVVVNVWGTWCPPCRFEFPFFQTASVDHGKRVAFLGVDIEDHGDPAGFLRRFPVSYPSYTDRHGRIGDLLGLQATPTTVFYDRRGRIAFTHFGRYRTRDALEQDIRRYALAR